MDFYNNKKIYSSPLIVNDRVIFAGGDGFLYALSILDGKLIGRNI